MKTLTLQVAAALLIVSTSQLSAAPSLAKTTYSIEELVNSTGTFTTYGGLMQNGSLLYYGNFNIVGQYDLNTESNSVYAVIDSNADTKALGIADSTMYMALDISYSPPYSSNLGTIDPGNGFTATLPSGTEQGESTYSVYDAAVFNDQYYFVANPGIINTNDQQGPTGSRIYRYNTSDPTNPVEIANIGGSSGGITFDSAGNLFYASQNWGEGILKFDASDVQSGGLTASNGTMVANVSAGSLGFLPDGNLVATTGWGLSLDVFDIYTGNKLKTIATVPSDYSESIGKFIVDGSIVYVLHTDWNSYFSSLYAINIIEPDGYDSWVSSNFPAAYPGDGVDSDGDEHSNYEEFIAYTSPTNKSDVLTINIEMIDGNPLLTWRPDNIQGRSYTLEGRESLTDGSWGVTNANSRFFRVFVGLE